MMTDTPHTPARTRQKSIKRRIVVLISALVISAILVITLMATAQTYQQMRQQTELYFTNQAMSIYDRIDQRIGYLSENTQLLTQNELMVNALTDAEGRQRYLPPLINNFMNGKDVISLNLLDYDGQPIFQTREDLPSYNDSNQLRMALAMTKASVYIENNRLLVIAPIEYYRTTQGALVVEFDLAAIIERNLLPSDYSYTRIKQSDRLLFSQDHDANMRYRYLSYAQPAVLDQMSFMQQLGVSVEIGIEERFFFQAIFQAMLKVLLIGLLLLIITLYAAYWIADSIVQPVLELLNRVKASSANKEVLCSPLGTHDELEDLARAFDERTLNLQHQAEHDALTQLPNRVLFIDRLDQAIQLSKRFKHQLAVLFIDLDRFKEVNDSFGHDMGDALILSVAQRIQSSLSSADSVARFGGDEFVVLINQVDDETRLLQSVQAILELFKQPFTIRDLQLFTTCSIGIATYPDSGNGVSGLLKNADAAMYKAKQNGRNTYEFYNQSMTQKAYERVNLERELRKAIQENEFEVYYQPQLDMSEHKVVGLEALIRWNHPKKGLVPPDVFIPFAEETGLIVEMDRWMMQTAMLQVKQWLDAGLQPGVLSLNLSMVQLNHLDFMDTVREKVQQANFPTSALMFEITETQIMRNPDQVTVTLKQLKNLGVSIAIDDFGTGHSSLAYLKRLPIDKLKIDQSFVKDIPLDKENVELVKAIINIAKSLSLSVIAEGVETQDQAEMLLKNGCLQAQGYLYAKPMKKTELAAFLKLQKSV